MIDVDVIKEKQTCTVRTDLTPTENKNLELLLKTQGQKKGWWIRQAILERYTRETKEIDC